MGKIKESLCMDDEAALKTARARGLELFRILTFSTLKWEGDRLANFLNSPCALSVRFSASAFCFRVGEAVGWLAWRLTVKSISKGKSSEPVFMRCELGHSTSSLTCYKNQNQTKIQKQHKTHMKFFLFFRECCGCVVVLHLKHTTNFKILTRWIRKLQLGKHRLEYFFLWYLIILFASLPISTDISEFRTRTKRNKSVTARQSRQAESYKNGLPTGNGCFKGLWCMINLKESCSIVKNKLFGGLQVYRWLELETHGNGDYDFWRSPHFYDFLCFYFISLYSKNH